MNKLVGTMSEENDNSRSDKSNERNSSQLMRVSVEIDQRNSLNREDVSILKQFIKD